jgi:beta-glucanase (GH16 family)
MTNATLQFSVKMRKTMTLATRISRVLTAAFVATLVSAAAVEAAEPVRPLRADNQGWQLVSALSDEFDGNSVDATKWNNDPDSWGTWSWAKTNAYVKEGNLRIRMVYEPHQRGKEQLFYKSGIIRSHAEITFGYFEARIKGASRFPGVCPAFWMIGRQNGESSEIDFMEIQEVQGNVRQIDCNLHAHRKMDGKLTWIRERREWIAPWDPRDDYHVYACETTPETIKWFIDGQQILQATNTHWNLPMNVILSMGLRTPLRIHEGGTGEGKITRPNPKASTPEGFPTEMLVDYVRVWKRTETSADPAVSK